MDRRPDRGKKFGTRLAHQTAFLKRLPAHLLNRCAGLIQQAHARHLVTAPKWLRAVHSQRDTFAASFEMLPGHLKYQ
jgi:hypothetical protein